MLVLFGALRLSSCLSCFGRHVWRTVVRVDTHIGHPYRSRPCRFMDRSPSGAVETVGSSTYLTPFGSTHRSIFVRQEVHRIRPKRVIFDHECFGHASQLVAATQSAQAAPDSRQIRTRTTEGAQHSEGSPECPAHIEQLSTVRDQSRASVLVARPHRRGPLLAKADVDMGVAIVMDPHLFQTSRAASLAVLHAYPHPLARPRKEHDYSLVVGRAPCPLHRGNGSGST